VAKPEWGIKRICISCGARYYDMLKATPVCPACGTEHNPELVLRSRRQRGMEEAEADDAPLATTINEDSDIELEEAAEEIDDEGGVIDDDLDDDVDGEEFIENAADLDDDSN
jgi:uncharacterized protein (TIGR02300 family)